jgi:hypothetical protein
MGKGNLPSRWPVLGVPRTTRGFEGRWAENPPENPEVHTLQPVVRNFTDWAKNCRFLPTRGSVRRFRTDRLGHNALYLSGPNDESICLPGCKGVRPKSQEIQAASVYGHPEPLDLALLICRLIWEFSHPAAERKKRQKEATDNLNFLNCPIARSLAISVVLLAHVAHKRFPSSV